LTARPRTLFTRHRLQTQLSLVALTLTLLLSGATNSLAETIYRSGGEIKTSGFRYPFPEPRAERGQAPAPAKEALKATENNQPELPDQEGAQQPLNRSETESLPAISARVAIIIDDIGYSLKQGLRSARFPAPLTLAVLPHTPNGLALAELGFEEGKTIMLHAPMSNLQQSQLDPGGLTADMAQDEFIRTLRNNIEAIPHIAGINNHMGSYLTQLSEPMGWLMTELKRQQLFFVDSRTSAESQAWEVAQQHGLSSHKRDIFLDHERDSDAIEKQFQRLIQLAKRRGTALAIGHPYPETLAVLERQIPQLRRQGIELVSIERLLPQPPATVQPSEPLPTNSLATRERAPANER